MSPRKLLANFSPKQITFWLILSIIAGFYLTLVIPIKPPLLPAPSRAYLELTATGEQGPQALDHLVGLIALYKGYSQRKVISGFVNHSGWKETDGKWIASETFPAKLTWEGWSTGKIRLVFATGPRSGVIKIRNGEWKTSLDLYRESPDKYELVVPLQNRYIKVLDAISFFLSAF